MTGAPGPPRPAFTNLPNNPVDLHDFTQGPIARHIGRMAIPIFAGMLFQTLYYLVDLYFVAKLGGDAVAGVSAAGNLQFIVMALTQVLSVGTMVLISHAAGRKDPDDANQIGRAHV